MVICQYFLNGKCQFGNQCKNEHVNVKLVVKNDIDSALKGNQWPLSCYGPFREKSCVPDFITDQSFEEIRAFCYEAKTQGNFPTVAAQINQQYDEAKSKMNALYEFNGVIQNVIVNLHNSGEQKPKSSDPVRLNPFAIGNSAPANNQSNTLFGSTAMNATNAGTTFGGGSLFGGANATNKASSFTNTFGSSGTASNNSSVFSGQQNTSSVFGGGTASQQTNSIFGGAANGGGSFSNQMTTPGEQGQIGGNPFGMATAQSNAVFGGPATFAVKPTGLFAQANASLSDNKPATGGNIFGQSFGGNAQSQPSAQSNVFGNGASTQPGLFGGSTNNQPIFGGSTAQPTSGIFGGSTAQPTSGIFGGAIQTVQNANIFGVASNTAHTTTTPNPFGNSQTKTVQSIQPTNVFASQSQTFGGNTLTVTDSPANNVFGGGVGNTFQTSSTQNTGIFSGFGQPQEAQQTQQTNQQPPPNPFQQQTQLQSQPQSQQQLQSQSQQQLQSQSQQQLQSQSQQQLQSQSQQQLQSQSQQQLQPQLQQQLQPQLQSRPIAPFGQPSVFGSAPTDAAGGNVGFNQIATPAAAVLAMNPNIYSQMGDLTQEEIVAFKADLFELGKIPIKPPPKELCLII